MKPSVVWWTGKLAAPPWCRRPSSRQGQRRRCQTRRGGWQNSAHLLASEGRESPRRCARLHAYQTVDQREWQRSVWWRALPLERPAVLLKNPPAAHAGRLPPTLAPPTPHTPPAPPSLTRQSRPDPAASPLPLKSNALLPNAMAATLARAPPPPLYRAATAGVAGCGVRVPCHPPSLTHPTPPPATDPPSLTNPHYPPALARTPHPPPRPPLT